MPRISVLIPVYNGAETIRESIASIQSQWIADIEIIVVDDGSTDQTAAILNEIALADKRVRVLTKQNGGIVEALNTGLKLCEGDYIARHDADDIAYPYRFTTQIDYLERHPECMAVSGSVRHIDAKGAPTGYVAKYAAPEQNDPRWLPSKEPYLIHPFLMIRRSALQTIGGYRYVFHAEDTDLYWRLLGVGKLHNLMEVLGDYRIHEGSISSKSIMNGRIAALNSQLAAISAARRNECEPDIRLSQDKLDAYQKAASIDAMVKLWKEELNEEELAYLRLSSLGKLLELTTHRPYELEVTDCKQMRAALEKPPASMTAENGKWLDSLVANAGGRLLLKGEYKKAWALLPPRLYPAAIARLGMRRFATPAIRRKVKTMLGKPIAPSDYDAAHLPGDTISDETASAKPLMPQSTLGKSATSGMVWLFAQSVVGRGFVFISQLVLAKILLPEDFGVLGLAYTITTLFGVFTNLGVDTVLQQRREKMRFWAPQAFWINLGMTSLVALMMAFYAPLGARFYHNEKVIHLVWILAASLPIASLAVVPQAKIQSLMKFKFLATYNTLELIAIQVMTILFALMKFGAISFVLPVPIMALMRAAVFWNIAPFSLRVSSFPKRWKILIGRGATLLGSTLALALIDQGDYIALGLYTSAYQLGIYYFAFKLSIQPVKMLATSFTGVMFPTLTSLSEEPERQLSAAFKASATLGVLIVPICFLQAAVAGPALLLLFGERWAESIPLVQILSIGLSLDALSWPLGSFLSARGEFARISKYQLLSVPFFYGLVLAGVHLGSVRGVAIAVGAYYVVHPIAFSLLTFCREGISASRVLMAYFSPLCMATFSFGTAYTISTLPVFHSKPLIQIIVIGGTGVLCYFLCVRKFVPEVYYEARKQLLGVIKKK